MTSISGNAPSHFHRLPVTTRVALGMGIELLAAPKFLAQIDFEERQGWVRCHLAERGCRS